MTDRIEDSTRLQPGPTRRAFLGAGALTLLGLAVPTVPPARAQTPKRGGTLVVAADVSPPGLDPQKSAAAHSWMIAEHVYSTLLRRDAKMNLVGDLAGSWQVVNDATFVFKLRKGVGWHHGRDLVADDVKYSFERMLDEKTASPWRSNWSIIDRVEAPVRPLLLLPGHAALRGHRPARHRGEERGPAEGRLRDRALHARSLRPGQHGRAQAEPELPRAGPPLPRRPGIPDHPGRGRPPGRPA